MKRRAAATIFFLTLTITVFGVRSGAQGAALPGVVVNNADHGIKDVRIAVADADGTPLGVELTTDADGGFELPGELLRPGNTLVLRKDGYDEVTLTIGPQHLVMARIRVVMQLTPAARPTPTPTPIWAEERSQQRTKAVELYNEAVELFEEADDNAEAKAAALRMMREAASLDPMFPEPLQALSAHAMKIQNWAEVSRLSEALLRIDPDDADAIRNLYASLVITHHFKRVGEAAIRLISSDPEKIAYVEQHAHEFFENSNFKMARALFEAITRVAPDAPNGFLNLGVCCARLGDRECTIASFERFLELAPEDHPDRATVAGDLANLRTGESPE